MIVSLNRMFDAGLPRAAMALALLCIVAAFALPAAAQDAKVGDITVAKAWARATPPWPVATLAFVRLENAGADDRLLSASAEVAGRTLLHRFVATGDRAAMEVQRDGIALPGGKTLDMRAEGYHFMLLNLKDKLVVGQTLPVTLTFEKAGPVEVAFEIRSLLPPGLQGGARTNNAPAN